MSLITIGASRAQTVAISGIAFAVFKNCPWTVMLAIARVTHVAMCRAAAWAVQCLQIFARTGQGQSSTVNDPRPAQATGAGAKPRPHWAQGPELVLVMTLRSDCVQVTRISVQVSLAGSLYFPALPQIITDSGSVTCCVRPGLAWAGECAGTRSVTESEMKWYNTSCWILYQPGVSGTQASVGDKTILLNLDFFLVPDYF